MRTRHQMANEQILWPRPCTPHRESAPVPRGPEHPLGVYAAPPDKSFLYWSIARNKRDVGGGTNATGADTDQTVELIRGRNSLWGGGWHIFYYAGNWGLFKEIRHEGGEGDTTNTSELTNQLSAMRGLTSLSTTWGNIHVTSRKGLKPTHPL